MYQFLLEFKSHAREEYLDHFDIPKLSIRCLKFEVAYHATFHIYPVTLKSDFSIPERKVRRDNCCIHLQLLNSYSITFYVAKLTT